MRAQPTKPAQRRAVLAACLALIAAFPGTALAQGAGDNQYQDPFGIYQGDSSQKQASSGSGSQGSSSEGSTSQGARSSSSGSSSSGSASGAGSASGSSSGATGSASQSAGSQLPRTGGEPLALGALGAGLLLAGVGLRLRLRRPLG